MSYAMPYSAGGGYGFLAGLSGAAPSIYPALSTVTWTNDSLPNSFSVTNEELHTKIVTYLNMHLAILPGSLTVDIGTNFPAINSQTVTIKFSLAQPTNESDVRFALLQAVDIAYNLSGVGDTAGNWGTFGYQDPPLGSSQVIGNTQTGTASSDSRGISFILGDPDTGDYDVIFADGSSGIFNQEGTFYNGNRGGIASIQISVDDSNTDDGFVVVMDDGVEVYFDLSGAYLYTYDPKVGPTASMTSEQYDALLQAARQTGLNRQPQPKSNQGFSFQGILDAIGLPNAPAALGITSGMVVVGAGILAYLVLSKK